METARRLVALALSLACVGSSSYVQNAEQGATVVFDQPRSQRAVELLDETGSPRQAEGVTGVFLWAVARFEAVGLVLPPATVTFHRERSKCRGLGGLWTSDGAHDWIHICVGGERQRRSMLLHELAHAWAERSLGDADRHAFVSRRGLESWDGKDAEWATRGIEQVAMIIAWGLEETCEQPAKLPIVGHESLAREFERLTSLPAPCRLG